MLQDLKDTQSLLEGHFELSSGLHSSQYFQCAKLLQYTNLAEKAGKMLAAFYNSETVDIVLGPALGGVIIGYETARALNKKSIFTERKNGIMCLKRGFEINSGERVLIVEDVITTAKSTKETIEIVKDLGGTIAGICCIVDRSEGKTGLDIKSLIQISPIVYEKDLCPLCQAGKPIDKPGSRTEIKV